MTYVFLADGFEEIEALAPIDILRRASEPVTVVGVTGKTVTGAHGIKVTADVTIDEALREDIDMIVLPGGLPGADNLQNSPEVCEYIALANDKGAYIAAICAAPKILGALGLLKGKEAICYPGFENELKGAVISDKKVVCDGNIITAAGMGVAVDFALKLVELLASSEASEKIRKGIIA
jgi:4-methyl-5(b-hydroxyethyl)-thiazole monophosphate biosynthesis